MNIDQSTDAQLAVTDHNRDFTGMRYVYPVISRRAGGVSVGINLNPNNACNWRCVYCQVPELQRGDAPPLEMALLRAELDGFLRDLLEGDFMLRHVPEETRRIVDVALAGNGEPTSAKEFPDVISLIGEVLREYGLDQQLVLRLITNGSRVMRATVQEGLRRMGARHGEIWFKVDAGSPTARQHINDIAMKTDAVIRNLRTAASLCPTWVQTCAFGWGDRVPLAEDLPSYLELLRAAGPERLQGVHLYSLARPSLQPEATALRRLSVAELEAIAKPIGDLGLEVRVNP
jgi:wyosine [tRNA(Phe)-imidazoG37] synthetase (radical SAM superfamily)